MDQEFKGGLSYLVSLRSTWATDTLSKTTQPSIISSKKPKFLLGVELMPVISALGRQRQEEHKFTAGLSCITINTLAEEKKCSEGKRTNLKLDLE